MPTLSEWAMILMGTALAGAGLMTAMRARRRAIVSINDSGSRDPEWTIELSVDDRINPGFRLSQSRADLRSDRGGGDERMKCV